MSSPIFEEEGKAPVAGGMATAQQKIEKQARQLAYDTRYQVKKEIGDKKVNPAAMKRLLLQRLQKSTAAPNIKVRAKQMLLGENYIGDVADFAAGTVASALFKVFVEGTQQEVVEEIELEYLKELDENPNRKYKVRVTDKKTGNSYVRYATRDKITQLRANPNIQSVEMTEYGEPREGEKTKGEQTAKAKSGKGLDPVGREDKDIDNDGDHDKTDKYLLNRRKVRGAAISKRKGVAEEFLADAATEDQNDAKITGKGVNNYKGKDPVVKIMPEDPTAQRTNYQSGPRSVYAHYEAEGEVISEKAVSKAQQKFMGMVYAVKKGAKPMSKEVAQAAAGMSKKEARKFAKTKHEGLPTHKEEKECGCEEEPKSSDKKGEMDVRELPTKMNMVKNKLRAMGLKMSYEPEGEQLDENPLIGLGIRAGLAAGTALSGKAVYDKAKGVAAKVKERNDATQRAIDDLRNSYELEGEVIDERTRERKGQPRPQRDRAMEIVRKMPNYRVGGMTRSGGTIAGHEEKRGVKKQPGAPTPKGETTADRLAQQKAREAGAKAAAQRAREEENRRRRLA